MAAIYVSYKSEEHPFVERVVARLERTHRVYIDYRLPAGADWRRQQLAELQAADAFVVFVSTGTAQSAFQNAEIGAARFCTTFVDQKVILPVVIDDIALPKTIADLDVMDATHRDVARTADEILQAMEYRRTPRVRLFVSHSHQDGEIAARLVRVLESGLEIPRGELRCTSLPGYKLSLGAIPQEQLRRELGSAACIVGIVTPNSVASPWVLFELGAAWAQSKAAIPLLGGRLSDDDIPGPFRGAAGAPLDREATYDQLIDELADALGWLRKRHPSLRDDIRALVQYVSGLQFDRKPPGRKRASAK